MADYKAGNLTLELFGIDRSAEKTITNVVNKLNLLQRSLNVFQKVSATAVGKPANRECPDGPAPAVENPQIQATL
jgi:hypothetical protein